MHDATLRLARTARIFIGSGYGDGKLRALSPNNGAVQWTFAAAPGTGFFGTPAATDVNVYAATRGTAPHVYAVAQASGALVWQTPLPPTGSGASVAVAHGHVFVNTDQHKLYALNQATGAILWSATGGGVLFYSDDHTAYGLNTTTGVPVWKGPIPGNGNPNSPGAEMAIALEILLVPNKGHLHAFR